MKKKSTFFKEFFREKKQVGAIAPSSRFLMKKMLKPINFEQANIIIELGPGNGVFTKGLLKKMKPDAKLFCFELNESFYLDMKANIHDDRLVLLNESAENIAEVLKKHGHEKANYIVSSLPLAVIPEPIKTNILEAAAKYLESDGNYIQFQYSLNAKKLLETKFEKVSIDFTPANIPPAFVYTCTL